jgi:formate-dependent nitrite reductase membrane component NrfD
VETIVFVQDKWSGSPHIPLYLFFGGLAAGTFLVAVLADLVGIRSRRAAVASRVAALAVVPILALAGFFLTSHLGKPERGLAFPVFFTNYHSWMTRGGWIVGASGPLMVLYAALWYFGVAPAARRALGVLGLAPAAALAIYTGLLLSGAGYVPLWSREHLPPLFLTSGLNTGLAVTGLLVLLAWPWLGPRDLGPRPVLRWLGAALLALVVVEGWELYRFMQDLASQGLLRGHAAAPTADRFQYQVQGGGALPAGTYTAVVTWVSNVTGAEEGMSADTPVRVAPESRITIVAPRQPGVSYNVYLGPSHAEARQVAANLGPGGEVTVEGLPSGGLAVPEQLQTGGRFLGPSGGRLAYRYVTGGPEYPATLIRSAGARASVEAVVAVPSTPTAFGAGLEAATLASWFWWGVVGLALALPVALTLVELAAELAGPGMANGVAAVKFASTLVGGLVLRFVIVWGGDLKAPLAFPPAKWPVPSPGGPTLPGLLPPGLGS